MSRQDSQPTLSVSVDVPATSTVPISTQAVATYSAEIKGGHASKEAAKDQSGEEGDIGATSSITGHPDFGTWTVQEIQLCQMRGRNRHTGAYISVGNIQLVD